jgi:2'-5' RNA ligase
VPRDNLHVTISFLGETQELDAVIRATDAAAAAHPPVSLHLDRIGGFPSLRRPRVLWIGLGGDVERLALVAGAIAQAMETLGFPREQRPFAPHLTVARFKGPAALEIPSVTVRPASFTAGEVTVFRSNLRRPAPVYERLHGSPLRGLS